MQITEIVNHESITNFAERLSNYYSNEKKGTNKKEKGQYFTPASIAAYMASLADVQSESIKILDPGAGLGILSVALIEKIREKNKRLINVELTLYENDEKIIPYLNEVMNIMKKRLSKYNVGFNYEVRQEDFVASNVKYITPKLNSFNEAEYPKYDIIISNPPYFKINKKEIETYGIEQITAGQPNIYYIFMAIATNMLSNEGQMIFITPRSFCSGLYYSSFRNWLIKRVHFSQVHIFKSRKNVFAKDKVLQENVITKFTKTKPLKIVMSTSEGRDMDEIKKTEVNEDDIIYKSNGHIFFRLPADKEELAIIRKLDKLPMNFYKLGYKISTGKVVAFRNSEYLKKEIGEKDIPLIWMHNIRNMRILWPSEKNGKARAIEKNEKTKKLLIENGNYVVMKRFTTKEQKKRFDVALVTDEDFKKQGYFALDNMLNYIYCPGKKLNRETISGIAEYLSLPIVDRYFRILNGHTQVNANEVYALPFPEAKKLEKIGKNTDKFANEKQERILEQILTN
ncbi:MAG: Eco57I restriction-modification methylase domain-containing protein [Candidatus Micrarchaeia archaeon]